MRGNPALTRGNTTMGRSYGVYGDRFAGTGQKHSLRYNSWLTVIIDGAKIHVRSDEFDRTYRPLLGETERPKVTKALEFEGIFHAKAFTVRVGRIK